MITETKPIEREVLALNVGDAEAQGLLQDISFLMGFNGKC